MATFGEIVYMCNDQLKLVSDDSTFTEDHILFIADKIRAFLLKQKYSDIKKEIPDSNFQTICVDLSVVENIQNNPCVGGISLRSINKIPGMLQIANPKVYPINYYIGEVTFISMERMKYVGYNKYLQNIIYSSLDPDNYLYFKSNTPNHLHLEKVKISGIFQDSIKASGLQCEDEKICDLYDREFPLESSLITPLIEMVVKELSGSVYLPKDKDNNASDDLDNLTTKKQ